MRVAFSSTTCHRRHSPAIMGTNIEPPPMGKVKPKTPPGEGTPLDGGLKPDPPKLYATGPRTTSDDMNVRDGG